MAATPQIAQRAFRGRNDDGSETTATWKAAINTIWTQPLDTNFRIRFLAERTTNPSTFSGSLQLFLSHNGGTFSEIQASGGVVNCSSAVTAGYTHGDDTTQQLGSGNFLPVTNNGIVEGNLCETDSFTWPLDAGAVETEPEYTLSIDSNQVAHGDTLEFRLYFNDSVMAQGYDEVPVLIVYKQSAASINGGTITINGGTLTIQ